jgi:hypothetical protein
MQNFHVRLKVDSISCFASLFEFSLIMRSVEDFMLLFYYF